MYLPQYRAWGPSIPTSNRASILYVLCLNLPGLFVRSSQANPVHSRAAIVRCGQSDALFGPPVLLILPVVCAREGGATPRLSESNPGVWPDLTLPGCLAPALLISQLSCERALLLGHHAYQHHGLGRDVSSSRGVPTFGFLGDCFLPTISLTQALSLWDFLLPPSMRSAIYLSIHIILTP